MIGNESVNNYFYSSFQHQLSSLLWIAAPTKIYLQIYCFMAAIIVSSVIFLNHYAGGFSVEFSKPQLFNVAAILLIIPKPMKYAQSESHFHINLSRFNIFIIAKPLSKSAVQTEISSSSIVAGCHNSTILNGLITTLKRNRSYYRHISDTDTFHNFCYATDDKRKRVDRTKEEVQF